MQTISGAGTGGIDTINEAIEKNRENGLEAVLQAVQEVEGWLSECVIERVAEKMGVSAANVLGVATFYAQFRLKPSGRNIIQICEGTACHVNGAGTLFEYLCESLRVRDGETTADGVFTLKTAACLGCCSLSPAMMINGEVYGNLTERKIERILADLRVNAKGAVK